MCDGGEAMTNTHTKEEEKSSVALKVGAALVVGALAGAAIGVIVTGGAGDEAPIKVKNGSLDVELTHPGRQWEPFPQNDTTRMHWRAKGGPNRDENEYSLLIEAANGKCSQTAVTGNKIRFTYSDNRYVEIEAKNKKTEVLSDVALDLLSSNRLLSYGPSGGYIASISIGGGSPICTFTDKADLTGLYMNEP
jgi:hypothetical protein